MLTRTLVLLAALGSATPVLGQGTATARSKTTGFMLGLGLNGTSVKLEDDNEADPGFGATLQLGYGFTPRFTGLIDFTGVVLDGDPGEGEVSLAQVFVAGRIHFRQASARWIPFFDLGLGGLGLDRNNAQVCTPGGCSSNNVSLSGGAFIFGGGLSFYATRWFAATGALHFGGGGFSRVKTDNGTADVDVEATTTRLNVGITWFPGR